MMIAGVGERCFEKRVRNEVSRDSAGIFFLGECAVVDRSECCFNG